MTTPTIPDPTRPVPDDASPRRAVTVVVVPGDRFGMARESLATLLRVTRTPHELIVVDGASPPALRDWLAGKAHDRGFRVLRSERLLTPNEARNLALPHVRTPWVAFVANDVVVARGWLAAMLEGASASGADVVVPLACRGVPLHARIAWCGNATPADAMRTACGLACERAVVRDCHAHALLVRVELLHRIGGFDAQVAAGMEALDFALQMSRTQATMVFEPDAVVTHVPAGAHLPLARDDLPQALLRCSRGLHERSIARLHRKWGVPPETLAPAPHARELHEGWIEPVLSRTRWIGERGWRHRVARAVLATALGVASRREWRRYASTAGR